MSRTDPLYEVEKPFHDAITALTNKRPPKYVGADGYIDDEDKHKFQEWCVNNAPYEWMTGLGVWEAAEVLVAGAVENGNILEPDTWERLRERARESSFELHRVEERVKYVVDMIEKAGEPGLFTDTILAVLKGEMDGELT